MQVGLTKDKEFIYVQEQTDLEKQQMQLIFNVRTQKWFNDPRIKAKSWDGYFNFYKSDAYIPIGLWKVLLDKCEQYDVEINKDFVNDIVDPGVKRQDVQDFFDIHFKDHILTPYEYQIESVYLFVKYRRGLAELATSSGKTLISYMIFVYIKHLFETAGIQFKMLMIVPKIDLVIQTFSEWNEYSEGNDKVKLLMVSGVNSHKKENIEDYDVAIGTYQSLIDKDDDFFQYFRCVLVDESHHVGAKSIKTILKRTPNLVFRIGVSGTIGVSGDDSESYGIHEQIGPVLYYVTSEELIKHKRASPVYIRRYVLNYLDDKVRGDVNTLLTRKNFDKGKLLSLEKELAIHSKKRLDFILKLIMKTDKNALILFSSVKKKYGKLLRSRLRAMESDKEFFYIDGSTKTADRNIYKDQMKTGKNKILIASFGTYAEGISIKNIHYVFLIESYKSEIIIKQSIGRGMRLNEGKEKVLIIDIVDDYRMYDIKDGKKVLKYKNRNNYLYRHGLERLNIYRKEKYPVKTKKLSL